MKYDIIIPVYWGDSDMIQWNVRYIQENLGGQNIFLVGPKSMGESFVNLDGVQYVDGNTIIEGMSKETIGEIIKQICVANNIPAGKRAGWYLQQFIKMGYALQCKNEYYITWDMDTVPINPIHFFSTDTGKPIFAVRNENHTEYFDTLNTLLPGRISRYSDDYSFVNQFMVFRTDIMKTLIMEMEQSESKGTCWWQKVLYSIAPKDINQSGFSEFETYGNYTMQYYPEAYEIGKFDQCRRGTPFITRTPNEKQIAWARKSYDCVTLETWTDDEKWHRRSKVLSHIVSMKFLVGVTDFIYKIKWKLGRK